MQAAAILAPGVSTRHIEPFRASGEIEIISELTSAAHVGAALVFGGDGSIHRQLIALAASRIPLLPVPMGSGNDFAHAMGIHSLADARNAWRRFCATENNVREIDIGAIRRVDSENETLFCNVAGVGIDSEINRRANAMPRWLRSHGGYVLAALATIPVYQRQTIQIESSESQGDILLHEPAFMVAVANTRSYGGGMRIAPIADFADGRLDICFVREMSRLRLLRLFPKVFRGRHFSLPEVAYFQSERLRIATERPSAVYADGEYACDTPLEISLRPRGLRVITAGSSGC
jgi:diacylglycerol kinase (ATP)